jgi:hypothetical protein
MKVVWADKEPPHENQFFFDILVGNFSSNLNHVANNINRIIPKSNYIHASWELDKPNKMVVIKYHTWDSNGDKIFGQTAYEMSNVGLAKLWQEHLENNAGN